MCGGDHARGVGTLDSGSGGSLDAVVMRRRRVAPSSTVASHESRPSCSCLAELCCSSAQRHLSVMQVSTQSAEPSAV